MYFSERNNWLSVPDEKFLEDCELSWFQASGPGGQKRNRKYSAVRLKHITTGITAEEVQSRSQNLNKFKAVKKLKLRIAMEVEGEPITFFRVNTSINSLEYPLFTARIFDALKQYSYAVSDAASELELSTSKLIKILFRDEQLWRYVSAERHKLGLSNLKSPKK